MINNKKERKKNNDDLPIVCVNGPNFNREALRVFFCRLGLEVSGGGRHSAGAC